MDMDGKIGKNGFDTSEDTRSRTTNSSRSFGYYGSGTKGFQRSRNPRPMHLRRNARTIGLILAFAAAIVVVSAVALVPSGKEKASQPELAEKILGRQPGFPYLIWGYTYASDGVTLMPNCDVTLTDLNTTEFATTVSTDPEAFYMFDITTALASGWDEGHIINVTATQGTFIGWNETTMDSVTYPGQYEVDVTLNDLAIPEFSMVIVPVMGMIALVAVVSLRRRGIRA